MLFTLAMKDIYLAGGCFWGVQEIYREAKGVVSTATGYANSQITNPTYKQVCQGVTNATETVHVRYDEYVLPLRTILDQFFKIIDPLSKNKQGGDVGTNYRTGVYYVDYQDLPTIEAVFAEQQTRLSKPIQVELLQLLNFYSAEDYHYNYLRDNPTGYCHVDLNAYKMK